MRALQLQDIETLRTLAELKKQYDVVGELKKEAFKLNDDAFLGTLAEMARDRGLLDFVAVKWIRDELKRLNKNQAIALSKLFSMAQNGVLPEGKFISAPARLLRQDGGRKPCEHRARSGA